MPAKEALITIDSFKGEFQVAKLLNRLLDTGLAPQRLLKHRSTVAQGQQHELLEQRGALQQLLEQFERYELTVQCLQLCSQAAVCTQSPKLNGQILCCRAASDIEQLQDHIDEEVQSTSETVQAEEEAFQVLAASLFNSKLTSAL